MIYKWFPFYLARASTPWLFWWHGEFGNIGMAVFFKGFLLILQPSCRILEMRQRYGVWREPKCSKAYGHNCFPQLLVVVKVCW